MSEPLRIGSLCTGTGALDEAVKEVFGGRVVWVADNDPGAAALLKHHHPDIPNLGDITAVDWSTVPSIDLLAGGFPCQDISNAGQKAGLQEGNRSGLWYRFEDAIEVLRPEWVALENVAAIRTRGLGVVLEGLARLGFDAEWLCLPASGVGFAHQRKRWILLAHCDRGARSHGWAEDVSSAHTQDL